MRTRTYRRFPIAASRTRRRQSTSVGSSLNTASPENLSHSDSGSLDSEVDLGTGPGLPMRSFTNTGFSSQNEDPRSRPTRRVNTVELERAIVPERAKVCYSPKQNCNKANTDPAEETQTKAEVYSGCQGLHHPTH